MLSSFFEATDYAVHMTKIITFELETTLNVFHLSHND
jgi:hypothetical protein